jgi:hypothetical protein
MVLGGRLVMVIVHIQTEVRHYRGNDDDKGRAGDDAENRLALKFPEFAFSTRD